MREAVGFAERACPACARVNPSDARFCSACGTRLGAMRERSGLHAADPLLGRVIAERYRIERLLGRGGMGVVYRVEHVRIGKVMAMKLLHGALARDKDLVKRFKREGEAVSKLDHPNTVQVFDFGQSEGMMFLVMEYLSGRDLGEIITEEGALPFERVARIATQVCGSVAQAHQRGIVHRDLKPENVMVLDAHPVPDFVKVLDFGLAKLRETGDAEKSITRAGSILGTPYYMAPEHIRGEGVDARSDVYAMGALIYKAITGVPPFWAPSPVGVLTQHLTEKVVPPSARNRANAIPPEADRIVLRAMAKEPRERFQSMEELRAELLGYLARVGQDAGLDSGRHAHLGAVVRTSDEEGEIATRGDIDRYERRLRRRSLISRAFALLLVVGLIGLGGFAWFHRPTPIATRESEPNDLISQADPLPEGLRVEAYLGKRMNEEQSDADFYRLDNPGGARRTVRIEVTAIPNMDIVFELFREGISSPLLTADSGGIGAPEVVPNFVIEGPTYYLRVRELWGTGRFPTENVSDPYAVRWQFVTPDDDEEREVNDSLELAEPISVGESRRGYIGWGGDQDSFCLAEDAKNFVVHLEPVSTLDLVLELVDRESGYVRTIDEAPLGQGETSGIIDEGAAGTLCFVVSARRPKEGLGNDPDERYTLRLVPSDSPATPTSAGVPR